MRGFIYRLIMKFAHKFNWHHAPPIYPDGDTLLWCEWCGFRAIIKLGPKREYINGPYASIGKIS